MLLYSTQGWIIEYLNVHGCGLPCIHGPVFEAIFHTRDVTEPEQNYKPVVLKNLVAIFQGFVLFEDCFTWDGFTRFDKYMPKISSMLQVALGYSVRHGNDSVVLSVVSAAFKAGRTRHIMAQIVDKKEPEIPTDPMEALLVNLIDRHIEFTFSHKYLHSSKDPKIAWERVNARKDTIVASLASSEGKNKLYTDFATMIPSELRGHAWQRPWKNPKWIAHQMGLKKKKDDAVAAEKKKFTGDNAFTGDDDFLARGT